MEDSISFDLSSKQQMTFNDELSRYASQLPSLTTNGQNYFPLTPNTIFSSNTPAQSRGFTNRNRRLPPIRQTVKQTSPPGEDDFLPQCLNENAKKRGSRDFAIRPKKRKSLRCEDPGCHNRTFADEPNLNRHLREVHGQAQYHCPVKTCERHSRGFKRRDNCLNHQKRSHGSLQSPTKSFSSNPLSPRPYSLPTTDDGDVESENESENGTEDDVGLKEAETLVQKMENLKALLKKKKRVEVEISRVKGELQQALQP